MPNIRRICVSKPPVTRFLFLLPILGIPACHQVATWTVARNLSRGFVLYACVTGGSQCQATDNEHGGVQAVSQRVLINRRGGGGSTAHAQLEL